MHTFGALALLSTLLLASLKYPLRLLSSMKSGWSVVVSGVVCKYLLPLLRTENLLYIHIFITSGMKVLARVSFLNTISLGAFKNIFKMNV
jgi:hypothetical protein